MRVTAVEGRLPDSHGSSCCVNASFGSEHALFANSNIVFGTQRSECLSNGPFWTETMKEHRKVRAKQPSNDGRSLLFTCAGEKKMLMFEF